MNTANTLRVKRIGSHDLPIPTRDHDSGGYDLSAAESKVIMPGQVEIISTGFAWEIVPEERKTLNMSVVGRVVGRSGMETKVKAIRVAGLIDGDYRGPVKVALLNTTNDEVKIAYGQQFAQMILLIVLTPDLIEVKELDDTARGTNGFGSTGD